MDGFERPKARLLIVDDHAIVRHGLSQLASRQPDIAHCFEADSAESALAIVRAEPLDLAVVDASMSGVSSLELVTRIKALRPKLPILLLALVDDSIHLERALRAGVNGYVLKQDSTEVLLAAMRKVLSGGVFLSERMQEIVLQRYLANARSGGASLVDSLSPREFEVLQLIGQGLGTSQIAAKLNRSVKTIEAHRATMKQKLGLKSGIELTQFAAGWVRTRE
jgi:two-component system, NarL family, response regulator NreC